MVTPSSRRAPASEPDPVIEPFPEDRRNSNCATEVEARLAQAAATAALARSGEALATAINGAVDALKPMAAGFHSLAEAQRKFCAFLVGHRLKLVASVPVVVIAIGGISPNAAEILGKLLKAWGVS